MEKKTMKNILNSVYSDGSRYFVNNPLPKKKEEITIYLRMLINKEIKHVILRTKLNGVEILKEMTLSHIDKGLIYYQTKVRVYEDILHYHFYLVTDNNIFYYNQRGITDYIPNELYDFKIITDYLQPSWVKEAVFYQIFPERFYNGDPTNDVLDNEYSFDGHPTIKIKDWNQIPSAYNQSFCLDFYGGDLEGIRKKIPYLKNLGVNALYLNPIFYAATVHKYDCLDYFMVDPHFGGDKALMELTSELHKNNMKIILDVSINHTGTAHKWFNKEGIFFDKKIGAYNNREARERNYYFFKDNNQYASWFGVSTLPTLNYTSQDLRKIIYLDEDSLVKKWLKAPFNIDGWRFDVADIMARNDEIQLHHEIWPAIRKSIKEENDKAYLLAEDWSDCGEYLNGNEWDSAMNYFGFTRPVREFVGEVDLFNRRSNILNFKTKMTAKMLSNRFQDHLFRLPFTIQENQFNLIDSHDVPRLHNNKNISFEDYKVALFMLFTMIGTPSIYYGDELDISGLTSTNEGCRYPMPWDKDISKTKNFSLYQKLCCLKKTEDALKYGGLKFISDDDYVLTYARFTLDEVIIVVVSMDDNERMINLPIKNFGKDEFTQRDYFEEKLMYEINDGNVFLRVPSHQSYIIKL